MTRVEKFFLTDIFKWKEKVQKDSDDFRHWLWVLDLDTAWNSMKFKL